MATSEPNAEAFNDRQPGRGKKWHWTPEEDALLIVLVHRFGAGSWDHIAHHIRGRSGKSCRVRWLNQLNPEINKSPFSREEQIRLLELHGEYGNKWSTLATFFPGRTDNQLKNQYHVLARSRCMKALASSPSPDPPQTPRLQGGLGARGLPNYGSPYSVPPGSQFSNVPSPGTYYNNFAPSTVAGTIQTPPPAIPNGFQMMPTAVDSSSFPYASFEPLHAPFYSNLYRVTPNSSNGANLNATTILYHVSSHGDFVIPDAGSAAFPIDQGKAIKGNQFINFLGVGNPSQ